MVTELEKQFFETFGIEPKKFSFCGIYRCVNQHKSNCTKEECPFYVKDKIRYPQITDRMWLELVRIYASRNIFLLRKNMEDFKYDILTGLIERPYEYRKQIRELFKGE